MRDLQNVAFETMMDRTVANVRKALGIDVHRLESIYAYEQNILHTRASSRLDWDEDVDMSDVAPPDAPDWVREKRVAREPAGAIERWAGRLRVPMRKRDRIV